MAVCKGRFGYILFLLRFFEIGISAKLSIRKISKACIEQLTETPL